MLQILTVCGAGLGSSFACQMSVDAVLKELGVEAKLDHTDISSVGGAKADIILSGKNFEKQFVLSKKSKTLLSETAVWDGWLPASSTVLQPACYHGTARRKAD